MRKRLLDNRALARTAVAVLALGLAALAGVAVWSTASTEQAAAKMRSANDVNNAWNKIFVRVSTEIEVMNDFLRDQESGPEPLASVIGSAAPSLDWFDHHGAQAHPAQMMLVRSAYDAFTLSLRAVVEASRAGDRIVVAQQSGQAALAGAAMRKQLTVDIQVADLEINDYLDTVRKDNRGVQTAAALAVSVDLALLVLCAILLLGYQRSAERQAQASRHEATHDPLTGLGNRVLLDGRLREAVDRAARTGQRVGLMLLDLDGFKAVNDTLGHHYGDVLLRQVAANLAGCVRMGDTAARLGGDEFAVLLPHVGSTEHATTLAERVLAAVQHSADLEGIAVDVSASIGVAVYPTHSDNADQLMQHADIAMYAAKRGLLGTAVYAIPANDQSPKQLVLLGELRRAMSKNELILHYQPKFDSASDRICGVEALVRWQHPEYGRLAPGEFVPMVEESSLMEPFTEHVLAMALEQCRRWAVDGLRLPMAVNIGARCLLNRAFPAAVADRLAAAGVPADMLTLEITETALIRDPDLALQVLTGLHALGVRLSIDDFSTGYSSMTFLTTMPIQELKIDRSFVSPMREDARKGVIVRAIVSMAASLDLQVVAEGVEDQETWAELAAMGCAVGQGYHLGRPVSAEDLTAWLADREAALVALR
jgi:diguanylate cyclase (GGDEF)-like protein